MTTLIRLVWHCRVEVFLYCTVVGDTFANFHSESVRVRKCRRTHFKTENSSESVADESVAVHTSKLKTQAKVSPTTVQ